MNEDHEVETLSFSLASYSVLLSVPIDRFFLLENYFTSVPDFNQPLSNYRKKKKKNSKCFLSENCVSVPKIGSSNNEKYLRRCKASSQMERRQFAEKETRPIYLRFATFLQRMKVFREKEQRGMEQWRRGCARGRF